MIIIKTPTRTFGITFSYRKGPWKVDPSLKVRWTTCEIFDVKSKDVAIQLGFAHCECSPRDNFVKETGRKEALTRVLKDLKSSKVVSKEESRKIWDGYFKRGTLIEKVEVVH